MESPLGYAEEFTEERLLSFAREVLKENQYGSGGHVVLALLREHGQEIMQKHGLALISAGSRPLPNEYVEALAPILAQSAIEQLASNGITCIHDADGDQSPRKLDMLQAAVFAKVIEAQKIPA